MLFSKIEVTLSTIALTSCIGMYIAGKASKSVPAHSVVIIVQPQLAASMTVPAKPSESVGNT